MPHSPALTYCSAQYQPVYECPPLLPPTKEEENAFVCLSVCLLAILLKNACMDWDEMLRVDSLDGCWDMDELINF